MGNNKRPFLVVILQFIILTCMMPYVFLLIIYDHIYWVWINRFYFASLFRYYPNLIYDQLYWVWINRFYFAAWLRYYLEVLYDKFLYFFGYYYDPKPQSKWAVRLQTVLEVLSFIVLLGRGVLLVDVTFFTLFEQFHWLPFFGYPEGVDSLLYHQVPKSVPSGGVLEGYINNTLTVFHWGVGIIVKHPYLYYLSFAYYGVSFAAGFYFYHAIYLLRCNCIDVASKDYTSFLNMRVCRCLIGILWVFFFLADWGAISSSFMALNWV